MALHGKETNQDDQAERQDVVLEGRIYDLQPFDRGEHRDGRGDDGVAIEQGGADHAEQGDHEYVVAHGLLGKRHERERAALAVVVGAQDEQHVLDRDDNDQGPQDERHDSEHHLASDCTARRGSRQRLLQGVQWTRADVAIDNAQCAQRQEPEAGRLRGCGLGSQIGRTGRARNRCRHIISLHRCSRDGFGPAPSV
jgi:hypothetical protein